MARELDEIAGLMAGLARATDAALDPVSVLDRTMSVLAPVVPVARATVWEPAAAGLVLVASHPRREVGRTSDLAAERAAPGAVERALERRGQSPGLLVLCPADGAAFDATDHALLDVAASQIAGALERIGLFREVMELERLKSDFIARVSHELRTPITIISGFLETLIAHEATLDPDRRLHMLDRSRVAASRLGHLIEELLILSRLEGGVLTPQPTRIDLPAAVETVRATSPEPDQVLLVGAFDLPVRTDQSLLVRALSLLVDNAIKYGGVAELSARRDGDRWRIEVRDRGPGFADDIRDTAFEMFTRSQSVSSVAGLGVGLAIARTIVEVLDGSITIADAAPGPGAAVTVSLPA